MDRSTQRPIPARWLLVACLLLGAARPAAAEVELYQPVSRPGPELAQIADGLLRPAGGAMADPATGAIVLRGSRAALDDALTILRQLDTPPVQFRIDTEATSEESLRLRELEIRGRVRVGDFEIGTVPPPRGRDDRVEIRGRVLDSRSAGRFRAEVVALEGRWAEIWTGELFPVRVRQLARRGGDGTLVYETTPALIGVQSGFRVRARALADGAIEAEIVPVVRGGNPSDGITETAAATRVRLAEGEQLAIGSVHSAHDEREVDYTGRYESSQGTGDEVLLVRIRRDPPAEPAGP